jgi:hypothetical protein
LIKEFIATYEIRSLSTIIRKGGVKRFEVVERRGVKKINTT